MIAACIRTNPTYRIRESEGIHPIAEAKQALAELLVHSDMIDDGDPELCVAGHWGRCYAALSGTGGSFPAIVGPLRREGIAAGDPG
jgi:hypothetical protein